MNWLAHTLLSKQHIDYQLGNVLADPLKGKAWRGASQYLKDGMRMHKAIDRFTDGHELLTVSKSRLGDDGLLKGVVLDLLYDHFLSADWTGYAVMPLSEYLKRFNQQAMAVKNYFPDRPQTIVGRIAATNLLGQYRDMAGFEAALQRIDGRLSDRLRARETASQYLPLVEKNYAQLQNDFAEFFPQLSVFFKSHPLGSAVDHLLIR
ncbi:ACP phosphodiesterase [Marinicella sediminis]|uniref:ACP phosphodiesterase n=1 Tax=Marinicella sediminis TaxID=1792834 RepID=A0ABV7J827_9GAMM|nr:ACP phosphodiesterase [Marinicella sediminis]